MRGPRPGGREARGGRGRGPVLPAGLFRENPNVKGHLHGLCDFKFRLPQVQLRLRDVCAFFYFPHMCVVLEMHSRSAFGEEACFAGVQLCLYGLTGPLFMGF